MGVSSYAIVGVGVLASRVVRKESIERDVVLYDQHTGIPGTHRKTITLTYLGNKVVDLAELPALPVTIDGKKRDLEWLDDREELIGYEVARTDSSNGGERLHIPISPIHLEEVRLQVATAMQASLGIDPSEVIVFVINYTSY